MLILARNCKFVFIPRQKLLKATNPTETRQLEDVLDEIEVLDKKHSRDN
jgi:hypothetical protein